MNNAAKEWRLKPLQVGGLPSVIDISTTGLTIGRDPSNQVVLDGEAFPQVSGYHARVSVSEESIILEDLGSKNGTLVNGKPVERRALRAGDIIQLGGTEGPRFLLLEHSEINATVRVQKPELPETREAPREAPGSSTIIRLKKVLGLPSKERDVGTMIKKRDRRLWISLLIVVLLILGGSGLIISIYKERRQQELTEQKELNQWLKNQIAEATIALDKQRQVWEQQKQDLEKKNTELLAQIRKLENQERVSPAQMQQVKSQLEETSRKLEQYNPINLDREKQSRREQLEKVLAAVVYVENKVHYRDRNSDKLLYFDFDRGGDVDVNIEDRGEPLTKEGSGSGFCISSTGHLITNAHVIKKPQLRSFLFRGWDLVAELKITVVFSGTSKRYPARVLGAAEDGDDIALLKLESFEGMPYIENFKTAVKEIAPGSEVRLFGFPLGKIVPQEGELLTASIFSGIVSRRTPKFLQIQAAVYPGNSGGPVVDENSRVVGIVTAVQTTPDGQIASDIGYSIPIDRAAKIWPPPKPPPPKANKTEDAEKKEKPEPTEKKPPAEKKKD